MVSSLIVSFLPLVTYICSGRWMTKILEMRVGREMVEFERNDVRQEGVRAYRIRDWLVSGGFCVNVIRFVQNHTNHNCPTFSLCVKTSWRKGMSKTLARASGWQPLPSLCPVSIGNALLNLLITAGPDKASAGDGKGSEKVGQCGGKVKVKG